MPAEDRELVQIEANEDVNSIRDRLSFIRGRRVLLVWPEDGTALTRKLDLVLIQREAMRRQIRLAIVTHDLQVAKNANELNISTFETIGASERGRWKRGRSKVFTTRWQRPKNEPEPDDLMDVASRVRSDREPGSSTINKAGWFFMMLLGLSVFAVIITLVAPSAIVTLTPAEDVIEISVDITINTTDATEIDAINAVIPSIEIPVQVPEQQLSTEATGTRVLGNTRATGTVVFINTTSSQIEIPVGTIVTTTDGSNLTFATMETVTLPGGDGEEIEVLVEAATDSAGDVGNVGENRINAVIGPLDEQVIVRNRLPTTGGQQQIVPVVTEADLDRLERLMYQFVQQRAYDEMPNFPGLTPRHVIIDETVMVQDPRSDWISISASVGDQVDSITMRMQALVTARAFDALQAENLVYLRLSEQVPRGRIIQPETVSYSRGPIRYENGQLRFTMTGRSVVAGRIDEDLLRGHLAGKSIEEALIYIQQRVDIAPGSTPQITVSPDLLGRLPLWSARINFEITAPASNSSPEQADAES
jgi:hypothetical protein